MVEVPFLVVERVILVLTMDACVWEMNISVIAVHAADAVVQFAI